MRLRQGFIEAAGWIAIVVGTVAIAVPNALFVFVQVPNDDRGQQTINWGYWETYVITYRWYWYLSVIGWGIAAIIILAFVASLLHSRWRNRASKPRKVEA